MLKINLEDKIYNKPITKKFKNLIVSEFEKHGILKFTNVKDDFIKFVNQFTYSFANDARRRKERMNDKNIYSQACFVLGYIDETEKDLIETRKLIFNLTKNGVDEIAIFIITPIPGSEIFDSFDGYKSLSELTFSPLWRKDFKKLNFIRLYFYVYFLFWKTVFHPIKIMSQVLRFFSKKFNTKMEMVPFKFLKNTFFISEQK